jgi:DNA-binding transcriptional LysR family regulator
LELRQIRQFTVLAEELNFRRAAERLHISQPPLSATIRRLEDDLGVRLFDRDKHTVALTAAGEVFLVEARRLLGQVNEAATLARSTAQGLSGVLRVSCVPSALLDLMPSVLRRFHAAYPQVRVIVTRELSARQIEEVQQQKVDVAIVIPTEAHEDSRIETTLLKHERFSLACPTGHRLATRSTASLRDIEADPLLAFFSLAESPGFSGPLLKAFRASALQPRVMHDYAQWGTSLVMVAGGFGLAIVPRAMRAFTLDGLCYVDLVHDDGSPITYPIAVATRSERRSRVAENFVSTLLAEASGGKTAKRKAASSLPPDVPGR